MAPLLSDLTPMLLGEADRPFADPDWLYEIKYDGYRILAEVEGAAVRLKTRNGSDATKWFPEVCAGLAGHSGGRLVLDGEVCVLDELGRSNFDRLQDRARRRRYVEGGDSVVFIAFDCLVYDGESCMAETLVSRKALLQHVLTPPRPGILYLDHWLADGRWLYESVLKLQLEGIVAKRMASPYVPGTRTGDWLKIKRPGAVPPERFKR